jgi:hypothetical protein
VAALAGSAWCCSRRCTLIVRLPISSLSQSFRTPAEIITQS